jgi:cytoskeletal protein RodZ
MYRKVSEFHSYFIRYNNRENPQLDLLLSVAILIIVYFFVLQTFFANRRNFKNRLDNLDQTDVAEGDSNVIKNDG